jgi:hypothetical protein
VGVVHHIIPIRIVWSVIPSVLAAELKFTCLFAKSHPAVLGLLGRLGLVDLSDLLEYVLEGRRVHEEICTEFFRQSSACFTLNDGLGLHQGLLEAFFAGL